MKVGIVKCETYDDVLIKLRECIDSIGGLGAFVKKGMKVALKVNLVMGKKPEVAATTHPLFVSALCTLIDELGATSIITESPGNLYKPEVLKGIYKVTEMTKAVEGHNAELNFDVDSAEVENPDAVYLKKLSILKPLTEADLIINLPKMKTHCQMVYTGAVKNMFGSIPGLAKMEMHFRMPDYSHFADTLIDIFLASKPQLSIMDGIIGMDGDGPTSGRIRNFGFILASENAFALDYSAVKLMGIDPEKVRVLVNAEKRGLLDFKDSIEYPLLKIDETTKIKDIKLPSSMNIHFAGGIIKDIAESLIKPKVVFTDRCKACGYCAKICPAKAITLVDKRPTADNKKCIRCFCCHELCPHAAVEIKKNFIMSILSPHKN